LKPRSEAPSILRDPVRIEEVLCNPDWSAIEGGIDQPVPGACATYSIELEGWALGLKEPVETVEVTAERGDILRVPVDGARLDIAEVFPNLPWADECGFRVRMGALNFPREFKLYVRARFANGYLANLGEICGKRRPLPSVPADSYQPIIVTTIGRTGSTWLSWVLSHHPEVISFRPWVYEPRVSIYHTEVLASLSQPFSYLQMVSGDLYGPDWWLGNDRTFQDYEQDTDFERWLGSNYLAELASVLMGRVDAIYRSIAEREKKPDARFFVEKHHPSSYVQDMIWDAFPGAREIILVRDLRDVVCSILAYGRQRSAPSFGREFATSDEDFIRDYLRTTVEELRKAWLRRFDDVHLMRYEDLIQRPEETLETLLSYIGVDGSAATIESVVAKSRDTNDEQDGHRTATSIDSSIGRWKSDLSPELQLVCEEALGDMMDAFGYTV
jgi:sulfotransferase family protein